MTNEKSSDPLTVSLPQALRGLIYDTANKGADSEHSLEGSLDSTPASKSSRVLDLNL